MTDTAFFRTVGTCRTVAAVAAVGGGALLVAGGMASPVSVYPAYLTAFMFWLSIALGCLALTMLHNLTGGGWGAVTRRVMEPAARTFPVLLVLFLPILAGLKTLYLWAREDVAHGNPLLHFKAIWLSPRFFCGRAVLYFLIWGGLAWRMQRCYDQEESGTPQEDSGSGFYSAPGLLLFMLCCTFAAMDWMMSLEPHWTSGAYGLVYALGAVLAALAFTVVVLVYLAGTEELERRMPRGDVNDVGNLLLGFVMLWTYANFAQFLIIWSGNIPEEAVFYLKRIEGGWRYVAMGLGLFHFAIPFLLLLSRQRKRRIGALAPLAVWLLAMRLIDLFWLVRPVFAAGHLRISLMDVVAPVAVGGAWLWVFLGYLGKRELFTTAEGKVHG
jgi:hypothetical protein